MDTNNLDSYYLKLVKNVTITELIKAKNHHQIKIITNDFEEPYVRILIQRGKSKEEQTKIAKAIISSFEDEWLNPDTPYTNEFFHKTIEYLTKFERDLKEYGKLQDADDPIQHEIDYFSFQNQEDKNSLDVNKNLDLISQFDNIATQFDQQVESLNRKIIEQLKRLLVQSEVEKELINKEYQKIKGWHDQWEELRKHVYECIYEKHDGTPIFEYPDDESFMTIIIDGYNREQQLEIENEQLRQQQEAWRESPEYKKEIARLEIKNNKQISVEQIRHGILTHVDGYSKIDDLDNFLLRVNRMLKKTAWDAVADDVEHEAKEAFKQDKPSITNNFYKGSQNVEHIDQQDNTYHK